MSGHKFVMKKSYTAFFSVVILMLSTAMIRVPCPVCHGTGVMSTSVGLENVTLENTENSLLYHVADFCLAYSLFQYSVKLVTFNTGDSLARGWVKVVLKGYYKSDVLDVRYISIEIPPLSSVEDSYIVYFITPFDVPDATRVDAELEEGDVPCLACESDGSLPLNTWPLVNSLRSSYEKLARTEHEFVPPPPPERTQEQGI